MNFSLLFVVLCISAKCFGESTPVLELGDTNPEDAVEVIIPIDTEEKFLPAEGNSTEPESKPDGGYDVAESVHPDPNINTVAETLPSVTKTKTKTGRSGQLNVYENPNYDPMTSHIAPQDSDQRGYAAGGKYTITEARLKEIRANFMYPYYDQGGNADNEGDYQKTIQASVTQVHKNLNFQLPFFGFRYNYTRVSLNGYLEFSDPPPNYDYPLVFPVKEWPKKNDPAFIGIFFSKCRIGNLRNEDEDRRKPGVYFRLERDLRTRQDRLGIELRERVKWDLRESVVGSDNFDPKHMIIVTWKNISFNGGFANSLYETNTFQMVLATDEVFTYAIFNYLDLTWTTHTEAGGDTRKGEGGVPAYVGFNAGNGTRSYEYKPYSQESVIRDLTGTGWANGMQGRHVFRIDENIMLGTCNKDIDGANLPLVFAPESGNMLGGTVVNITGPCFSETDQVTCNFDHGKKVYGVVVDRNRAICVQPRVFVEGWVDLEIAVGPGTYKWKGKYYIENPQSAAQKIYFKDNAYREKSPKEIKISWEKYNLTTNDNANIRISLWGYRETTIKPAFLYITDLQDNVQNTGEYTIIPSQYRNRDNEFLDDMKFGFIQINLTEAIPVKDSAGKTVQITPVIWSRPIPLGWYFGPQWERKYGSKWVEYLCNDWLRSDRYLKNFAHELPQCPCTLEQALVDKGTFLPDTDCDKDTNRECPYNYQAVHCVRSGSPTLEGAEQQCCYDKNGYLTISYDQQWGSSPRRVHNIGLYPWDEASKVPTLSQWYHDMVPKFFCCLWQEEQAVGCETLRFERRPTQDCVAYQGPAVAGVYGDPHIITFDNFQYTFNGKGEFVLVKSKDTTNNLEVQGRFEQMDMNAYGEVAATQLTSIVAKGNSSTIIEVRKRPLIARWRYVLDVIVNNQRIYFDRPSLKFQHFPGVTVYTPTYIFNQSEVIIMFDTGAGVEVVQNSEYISARVFLPWSFVNKTVGLFGNWSFNMEDDLTLPDGTFLTATQNVNDMSSIYNDFGIKWMLDDNVDKNLGKSLFFREFGRTASNYNNKTFKPQFSRLPEVIIPENRSIQRNMVYEYCLKEHYECYYDYAMTLNKDLAHFTQNYKATILKYKETASKKVVSCGVLETPRFGKKSNYLFVPGVKVTFECNEDFILVGDNRRTCMPNGRWDIPEYGYTECLRQQEYSARTAAIASGIVLAIIIPLVLLLTFGAYRVFKSYKARKEEDEDAPESKPALRSNIYASNPRFSSPESERTSLGSMKKRQSYDGSYKTGEPLPNKPDVEFEEKEFDPHEHDPSLASSPSPVIYSEPFPTNPGRPRSAMMRNSSQSSIITDV